MGVPACLWRRTGEIYKGNREFTELVGVDGQMMREVFDHPWSFLYPINIRFQGRLCIYELMAEESAVNYWQVHRFSRYAVLGRIAHTNLSEIWKRCVRHSKSRHDVLCATLQTASEYAGLNTWSSERAARATERGRVHQLLLLVYYSPRHDLRHAEHDRRQFHQVLSAEHG
jgi:hypothetical protein